MKDVSCEKCGSDIQEKENKVIRKWRRISDKFILMSGQEINNSPFNDWKTFVLAFLKKYEIDYSLEEKGFEITEVSPGQYKIYLTWEEPMRTIRQYE